MIYFLIPSSLYKKRVKTIVAEHDNFFFHESNVEGRLYSGAYPMVLITWFSLVRSFGV